MVQPDYADDGQLVDLAGAWVFLAGATGRVGLAAAAAFARRKANLVLHASGRSQDAEKLAARLAEQHGVSALPVAADVTEPGQLRALRERLTAEGVGALRALVNCTTGYSGRPVGVAELSAEEFRRVVNVDLVGAFLLVKELLPLLEAQPGARVVLFSSLAGLRGRASAAHLCAAKSGVQGLMLALARELEPRGVAVNAVAPGPVMRADGSPPPGLPSGVVSSSPGLVASAVVYLASPFSTAVQGQMLVVGGQP
jgi:NAD(P)-dependent dehydrogenase (short-subunit alcohol dehydrogenase family)